MNLGSDPEAACGELLQNVAGLAGLDDTGMHCTFAEEVERMLYVRDLRVVPSR